MKILNIVGARPNFIKIAPLMDAMARADVIDPVLVHTGQHYDENMSGSFFDDLQIPRPDFNLEVGSGSREEQIDRIMSRFDPLVASERPDVVLVVGDVNSTVACARVANQHRVAVAHVEAGLRSADLSMPEEVNRIETDRLSDLLFVTEQSGMNNLDREGVSGKAFLVGNVMIDSLKRFLPRARTLREHTQWNLSPGDYFLCTFHRPSNVDGRENLEAVLSILEHTASIRTTVVPLHPRTEQSLRSHGLYERLAQRPDIRLIPPLGYLRFLSLMSTAAAVITDSGGIQEETTFLQIPCITMRDNTERPVTVELGTNILAGTDPVAVMSAIDRVSRGESHAGKIPPLWDGQAAERITRLLIEEVL